MRLIDADALKEHKFVDTDDNYRIGWNDALDAATNCEPTVDAVPVKHGMWVGNERHTSCSICGQTYCVPDGQEGCLDMTFYKYCPNCGADMKGEQE